MTKHQLHSCEDPMCQVCIGGLAFCTVCNGGEGSLPTECPGEQMHSLVEDEVMAGKIDYNYGRWINLPLKGSE